MKKEKKKKVQFSNLWKNLWKRNSLKLRRVKVEPFWASSRCAKHHESSGLASRDKYMLQDDTRYKMTFIRISLRIELRVGHCELDRMEVGQLGGGGRGVWVLYCPG